MSGIENLTGADATHKLACRHCIGRSCKEYTMKCLILKGMGDGRYKILVFGDTYWKDRDHVKRIRYVSSDRLTKITAIKER